MATAKGYLDQERKNIQYNKLQIKLDDSDSDHFPKQDKFNQKTHQAVALLFPFNATSKTYGDINGRFPYLSSSGNQYIPIIYDHDSNAILTEPLKNRKGPEIKRGWLKLNLILAKGGNEPKMYLLDNEASTDLKTRLHKITFSISLSRLIFIVKIPQKGQSEPLKKHLLTNLAGADPNFPVSEVH